RVTLDISPFGKLRMGLVIFFLTIEFVGTKLLGLNFSGFTIRECKKMTVYDPILMEIGKKYAAAVGGGWAPEYRLAFSACISTVCYLVAAYLARYFGAGVKDVFLNLSDGVVGMVVPGTEAPESSEIVPNTGVHNTVGT